MREGPDHRHLVLSAERRDDGEPYGGSESYGKHTQPSLWTWPGLGQATGRVPEGGASPLEASHEQITRGLCPEKPGGHCPRAMGASQPASLQRRLCRTSVSGHRGPGGRSRSGPHRTWFGSRATPAVGPEHPWGPLGPRRSLSKRGTIPTPFHSPGSEPARRRTRLRPLPHASHQETLNHTGSSTAAARDILKETDYLHFGL